MKRIELRLNRELLEQLLAIKPRTLPMTTFCEMLIERGLDTGITLGGPSKAGTPSSNTSSNSFSDTKSSLNNSSNTYLLNYAVSEQKKEQKEPVNASVIADESQPEPELELPKPAPKVVHVPKRGGRKRQPPAQGPEPFERFWHQYQAITKRAANQSKPRALEVWKEVVQTVDPDALCRALGEAVTEQSRKDREGGFGSPFPDCFRWLRDGYYEAHLKPAVVQPPLPPEPVLAGAPADPFACPF